MAKKHHLAELQLAIMHVLWNRGSATVAEVRSALAPDRMLAHTTVGTMLAKMEEKGQVRHRSDGRVNIYRPAIRQDQVSKSMVKDLTNRLFGGDVKQMVCHLLDAGELTPQDLADLRRLIGEREKQVHGASYRSDHRHLSRRAPAAVFSREPGPAPKRLNQ